MKLLFSFPLSEREREETVVDVVVKRGRGEGLDLKGRGFAIERNEERRKKKSRSYDPTAGVASFRFISNDCSLFHTRLRGSMTWEVAELGLEGF